MIRPEDDPTSIGNILVQMQAIAQDRLLGFIEKFREREDIKLGEFLVENKVITKSQVAIAMMKQYDLRHKRIPHTAIIDSVEASTQSTESIGTRSEEIADWSRTLVAKA